MTVFFKQNSFMWFISVDGFRICVLGLFISRIADKLGKYKSWMWEMNLLQAIIIHFQTI